MKLDSVFYCIFMFYLDMRLGCQSAKVTNEAWFSKYQPVMIFSTTHMEIHSMAAAGSERGFWNATPAVQAEQEDGEEQPEQRGFLPFCPYIVHMVSRFGLHNAGSELDDSRWMPRAWPRSILSWNSQTLQVYPNAGTALIFILFSPLSLETWSLVTIILLHVICHLAPVFPKHT